MHQWKTRKSTSFTHLLEFFTGFEHATDEGYDTCKGIRFIDREFKDEDEAGTYLCNASYGDNRAACAILVTGKKTKEWETAYARFKTRRKEFEEFDKELSIAYGRTSEKVTCPHCGSSMARKFLSHTRACPVCGSSKVISQSNWDKLDLKRRLMAEADNHLSEVSGKCGIYFMAAFEWHC